MLNIGNLIKSLIGLLVCGFMAQAIMDFGFGLGQIPRMLFGSFFLLLAWVFMDRYLWPICRYYAVTSVEGTKPIAKWYGYPLWVHPSFGHKSSLKAKAAWGSKELSILTLDALAMSPTSEALIFPRKPI